MYIIHFFFFLRYLELKYLFFSRYGDDSPGDEQVGNGGYLQETPLPQRPHTDWSSWYVFNFISAAV